VVFQVTYEGTSHARFPEDGKLRELNPGYFWTTVIRQSIMPGPDILLRMSGLGRAGKK